MFFVKWSGYASDNNTWEGAGGELEAANGESVSTVQCTVNTVEWASGGERRSR